MIQIPAIAVKKIVPILTKQVSSIQNLMQKLSSSISNLPPNVKCNDPQVKSSKDQLSKILKNIKKLKKLLKLISTILKILKVLAIIAAIGIVVALVIPAIPGVPTGPTAKLLQMFAVVLTNILGAIAVLKGILAGILAQINSMNTAAAAITTKLSSICNNEPIVVSAAIASILDNQVIDDGSGNQSIKSNSNLDDGSDDGSGEGDGLDDGSTDGDTDNKIWDGTRWIDLNDLDDSAYDDKYNSEFYNKRNVSDEDMDFRIESIIELLENEQEVMINLIEAPSDILRGNGSPIESAGKINDFYINIESGQVYGPKTDAGWQISEHDSTIKQMVSI